MDERLANAIIEFTGKNQGFEAAVSALTSGILTPDPKMLVLLAMDREKTYSRNELFSEVVRFSGLDVFPVILPSVWHYCNGDRKCGGSLETIGAVAKTKSEKVTHCRLTDAGELIMQPIAAQALRVVGALHGIGGQRYKSMYRLFGGVPIKKAPRSNRRGYNTYAMVKELVNGNGDLTAERLSSLAKMNPATSRCVLDSLSNGGFIDYITVGKSKAGKRSKGWSKYKLIKGLEKIEIRFRDLDEEEKIKLRWNPTPFNKVVDYISKNPMVEYEHNELARQLGIRPEHVSSILSFLERKGFIEAANDIHATAYVYSRANPLQTTYLIWEMLLEPIGRVASVLSSGLSPDAKIIKLKDAMQPFYQALEILENQKVGNGLFGVAADAYNKERSSIGPRGGEEVRKMIMGVFRSDPDRLMGETEILEKMKSVCGLRRDLSTRALPPHLKMLEERKAIEKVEHKYKLRA